MHGDFVDLMSPSPAKKSQTSSDAEHSLDEDGFEESLETMIVGGFTQKSVDVDKDSISEGTPPDTIGMSASSAHAPSHPSKFWGKGLSKDAFSPKATTKKKQSEKHSESD